MSVKYNHNDNKKQSWTHRLLCALKIYVQAITEFSSSVFVPPSYLLASLHPSLPRSLPAVHPPSPTQWPSLGESCLPSATGPTNRCCSREYAATSGRAPRKRERVELSSAHWGSYCLRSSDLGKYPSLCIVDDDPCPCVDERLYPLSQFFPPLSFQLFVFSMKGELAG